MWWLLPLLSKTLGRKGGPASTAIGAASMMGLGKEEPVKPNTDLTNKIAQNQLWGNIQTADTEGDMYSPFFGASKETPMPNTDVGFNLPGQQTPFNQSDLFAELLKRYLSTKWR